MNGVVQEIHSLREHPVRRTYDQLAPEYDRRWRPYIDVTMRTVLEAVRLAGSERLLDVPCGTGELASRLLAQHPDLRITGVDLSRRMLEQAQRKDLQGRVTWIESDASRLPLPDETFDWVVCANSFHYFRSPQASLAEMSRVLRREGRFVLVDWCDDYFTCKVCGMWLRWWDPAFHKTYSLADCRTLVAEADFRLESAHRFRVNWLWGLMCLVCRREQ